MEKWHKFPISIKAKIEVQGIWIDDNGSGNASLNKIEENDMAKYGIIIH